MTECNLTVVVFTRSTCQSYLCCWSSLDLLFNKYQPHVYTHTFPLYSKLILVIDYKHELHSIDSLYNLQSKSEFTGADPGFPIRGAPTLKGAPTYKIARFSQKLHEIKKIWSVGGGACRGCPSWIRHWFRLSNWIMPSYYSSPKHKSLIPRYLIHSFDFCTL